MLSLRNPNARVLTKFMKITGFFQKLGSKCVILMKIAWGLKMCDSKADCIRLDRFSSNSTGLIVMVDDFLFCLSRVMRLNPMTNSLL